MADQSKQASGYIVGAYVTAPTLFDWDQELATAYWDEIKKLDRVRGIEHDFWGKLHTFDDEWFLDMLDPAWDVVFTCVPGTMSALKENPRFGLASDDQDGRKAALEYTERAREGVARINAKVGRNAVIAVQLHSAPTKTADQNVSSADSFAASLDEIRKWDWMGARLTIEHCDAAVPEHPPAKGMLMLEEEIKALQSVNASGGNVGITINWGRSAIEGRNARIPVEHIEQARAAGLLTGLMFSGVTEDASSPYGAWGDSHVPSAAFPGSNFHVSSSLMTEAAVRESIKAAGDDLLYTGIKLMDLPNNSSVAHRIGINRDGLRLLDRVLGSEKE